MATEIYDARKDPDVLLLSPFYTDEFLGSRALAYIRKSDHLPGLGELGLLLTSVTCSATWARPPYPLTVSGRQFYTRTKGLRRA